MKIINEDTDKLIEWIFNQKHQTTPKKLNDGSGKLSVYLVDNELVVFGLDRQGIKVSLKVD